MASIEHIRNTLIDRIMSIKNKDFLSALEHIVANSNQEEGVIELTEDQKAILELSQKEFEEGKVMGHDALKTKTKEWLKRAPTSK